VGRNHSLASELLEDSGYCVSYQTEHIPINESQELIQERKKAHDFLMDVWRWYNKGYYEDLIV
jgi:hypothetical protein